MGRHAVPLIGFAASGGTGKTNRLPMLVPPLRRPGLRVAGTEPTLSDTLERLRLFRRDPRLAALATDGAAPAEAPGGLPPSSINDTAQMAGFVFEYIGWSPGLESELAC